MKVSYPKSKKVKTKTPKSKRPKSKQQHYPILTSHQDNTKIAKELVESLKAISPQNAQDN